MSGARVTTTVAELRDALASEQPPLVLDVRWALGDPYGRDHYADAHIPGAVYVDLDTELAAPPSPEGGRHPLPKLTELQAAARGWGLREGQPVVLYDDLGNTAAARGWWLLRYAGVTEVTLLDGALGAWRAADLPWSPASRPIRNPVMSSYAPADYRSPMPTGPPNSPATDCCWTPARANGTGVRWSRWTRARGTSRARCPPPAGENLAADGTFLPPELLRKRFEERGAADVSRIGVYCGSGVTAAHQIAALALAGFEATLFAGSWSAWSTDPTPPGRDRTTPVLRLQGPARGTPP